MAHNICLDDLAQQAPALTETGARFFSENCMTCFDFHNHTAGVEMQTDFMDADEDTEVHWAGEVTAELR